MKKILLSLVLVFCLISIGYSGIMQEPTYTSKNYLNPIGFDEKDSKTLAQISAELKRLNRNIEKLINQGINK